MLRRLNVGLNFMLNKEIVPHGPSKIGEIVLPSRVDIVERAYVSSSSFSGPTSSQQAAKLERERRGEGERESITF